MPYVNRVGQVGSGKSLEAVEIDIAPALRDGRYVLHNIEGFNVTAVSDFIGEDISHLVREFTLEELRDPKFWYHPEENPDAPTRPGCLLVIDEAREAFPAKPTVPEERVSKECLNFFRKHRHYTDEQGRPMDIVTLTQLYTDIHGSIRNLATKTIETRKMGMLGFNSRYRIRVYEGAQNPLTKSNAPLSVSFRKYNPKIFALYKSAQTSTIKHTDVSRSTNLLKSKWLRYAIPLMLVFAGWGFWWAADLFTSGHAKSKKPSTVAVAGAKPGTPGTSGTPGTPAVGSSPVAVASTGMQLMGDFYIFNGMRVFLIADASGHVTYYTLNDFNRFAEFGPYLYIQLKDGTVISQAYRPPVVQQPTQGGTSNAQTTNRAR